MLFSRLFESKASYRERKIKFIEAARNGRIEEVKECLQAGRLRVDCQDKTTGETALIAASKSGQKEVIEYLLSQNSNINMQNINSVTALMVAAENGKKEVAELLISRKCNMEYRNKVGWTAIMIAAYNGFKDIVELLITNKCNIDHRGKLGRTAFAYSCIQGHVSIAILLIESGCNFSLKDNDGKSAMDHLKEKKRSAVKEVQAAIDAKLGHANPSEAAALVKKVEEGTNVVYLKKEQNDEATAAFNKQRKEDETAFDGPWSGTISMLETEMLLKKRQEQEAAVELFKKKQEEESALVVKRQQEERARLVSENIEDIQDVRSLLIKIGFAKGESKKYAEVLVLDHQINSEAKFQLRLGVDRSYYYSQLQLTADSIKLVERYLKTQAPADISLPIPTEPVVKQERRDNSITSKEFTFKGGIVTDAVPFVPTKLDKNNPIFDGLWSGTISMLETEVVIKEAIRKRDITHEAAILKYLQSHKDVSTGCVRMYGVDSQLPPSFIVIERFGINLRVKLLSNPRMDIKLRRIILENMLKAVADLHGLGVMHGDMKPQNILVDENYNVKLCDFDSARIISVHITFPCDPVTRKLKFSPEWASPEVYNGSYGSVKASFSIDMFSVGLIAALLEDKSNNFPNGIVLPPCDSVEYYQSLTDEVMLHSNVLKLDSNALFHDLIVRLCSLDPTVRPTSNEVLHIVFDKTSSTRHVEAQSQTALINQVISRLDNITDILRQFGSKMNELVSSNKDVEALLHQVGNQVGYMSEEQAHEMEVLHREIQQATAAGAVEQITAMNNKINTILQDTWKIPTLAVVLKKSKNRVFRDDYALYFLCEHTLELVPCGPKGEGFEFKQLKESYADTFKKMAPVLMVGMIMLKIAVTMYGIPIPLPDMASMTKADSTKMLNSMMKSLDVTDMDSKIQAIASSANPLDVINQANITTNQQREAYTALLQFLDKPEYKPHKFGVVKVTSKSGITKWIKDDPAVITSFHECDGQRIVTDSGNRNR